jgi:hypothetical protein
MLFALGAVSSALDMIQSLTNSKSSASQDATNPFAIDSGSTSSSATSPASAGKLPQIAPETMNALFAAQSQSSTSTGVATSSANTRDAALKDLFSQLDADGDGKISKSEFENALGAGGTNLAQADDVFSKMDTNSDGSVSMDEMSKALKSGHHGHHGHHAQAPDGGGSDPNATSSAGSTSTTTTAADGSTTTTVTYADGFKMSTTVPGASSASRNSAYDLFAQLMQQQGGQGQGASAGSSMSMSV